MTTEEHLQKIKAKCMSLLAKSEYVPHYSGNAEAGWRVTIEIVEILLLWRPWAGGPGGNLAKQIIAAWPEELL